MTTLNYNYKINEDFLDDVCVEDEVDDDIEVSADEQSYEYLLRIDFKNKNAADKLGVLLKELAEHQPEISQYGYYPRVNNIDLEYGVFELEMYDDKLLGEPFNAFAFNCDFRSAYAAMRFLVNVCKIMQRFGKRMSFTVENLDGEDEEVECDKILKYMKSRLIHQDGVYALYRATHVLMDDYNELRKTERCLTMVLELFDVTQAIVNNYPEFYLGNSEVVLCEDVPSLDGLPFDIMMFKQKYENTTSTFLVIEDYDIVRASKGLMPSFAGNMFNPDGFSPKYERESYQKDMYKRHLSFHNSQINVINHRTKYYATLLFCAFVGYTHYSNSSETGETDDHSQLVLASFSTKVRKTTVKLSVDEFIKAIYDTTGKKWSVDRKQLAQTLEQVVHDGWTWT